MEAERELLHDLRGRQEVLVAEKDSMVKTLEALRGRIEAKIKHAPKRPALTEADIDAKIEELEYRRSSTGALTLPVEKKILYEIAQLRQQKNSITEFTAYQAELDAMKAQREELHEKIKAASKSISELRDYVRKLEVLERLRAANPSTPILSSQLRMGDVRVKQEVTGRLIGKGGQTLKRIEDEAIVAIEINPRSDDGADAEGKDKTVLVRIIGLESGVLRALDIIHSIETEEETTISVSQGLLSFLLSQSGAVLKDIERQCDVKLKIERSTDSKHAVVDKSSGSTAIAIRGSAPAVDAATKVLQAFEASKVSVPVDTRTLPSAIGKGGANLKKIREDTGAEVQVVRAPEGDASAQSAFLIYGNADATRSAAVALSRLIGEVKELEEVVEVPRDAVPWLVGASGERISAFQKANDVYARILRGEDEGAPANPALAHVVLKGTTAALDRAVVAFKALLHEYHRTNKILVVSAAHARTLIGPGASGIKKLRADTGAAIEVVEADREKERLAAAEDKKTAAEKASDDGRKRRSRAEELGLAAGQAAVTIRGEEPNVAGALTAITNIIRSYTESRVRVSGAVISALIANKGAVISALQKDSGAVIDIERDEAAVRGKPTSGGTLLLSGTAAAVADAEAKVRDLTDAHQQRSIALPDPGLVGEIVGKSGANIKALEEELGVELTVQKESMSVLLTGPRAALDTATVRLQGLFTKFAKEHATVFVDPQQIPSLIGRGGANIKALQEETGATVYTETGTGEIRISGSETAVAAAKAKIADICKLDQATDTLAVHVSALGQLIGKGGGNVRKLEETYRVSIAVNTTTGVFTLRGDADNISAAKVALRRQTREALKDEVDVQLKQDRVGALVGVKGARVRQFELHTGASFDLPKDRSGATVKVHLRGTPLAVKKAQAIVEALNASEHVRVLARPPIAVDLLLGPEQPVVRALEAQNVKIAAFPADSEPEDGLAADEEPYVGTIVVHGGDEGVVQRTTAALDKLFALRLGKSFAVVPIPSEYAEEASKSSSETSPVSLRARFGVGALLDRDGDVIVLWGTPASVDAARATVGSTVTSLEARRATVPVEAWMVASLIGKKGAGISSFESETHAKIQIERDAGSGTTDPLDTTPVPFRLTASDATHLAAAKTKLESMVAAARKRRVILSVPGNAFGMIIGKGGATIRKILDDTGANVDIDRDRSVVIIRGTTEEAVDAAKDAVSKILEEADIAVRPASSADLAPMATRTVSDLSPEELRTAVAKLKSLASEVRVQFTTNAETGSITLSGRNEGDLNYVVERIRRALDDSKKPVAPPVTPGLPPGVRAVPGMDVEDVLSALKKGKRSRRAKKKGEKADDDDEETAAAPAPSAAAVTQVSVVSAAATKVAGLSTSAGADELLTAALSDSGRSVVAASPVVVPVVEPPRVTPAPAPVQQKPAPTAAALSTPVKAVTSAPLSAQAAASLALGLQPVPTPAFLSAPAVTATPGAGHTSKAAPTGASIALAPLGPPPALPTGQPQAVHARGPPPGLASKVTLQSAMPAVPPAAASPARAAWGSSAKPQALFSPSTTAPGPSAGLPSATKAPATTAPATAAPSSSTAHLAQLFANLGLPSTGLSTLSSDPTVVSAPAPAPAPVTHALPPSAGWGLGPVSQAPAAPGSAAAAALAALQSPVKPVAGRGAPRGTPAQPRPTPTQAQGGAGGQVYMTTTGVPIRLT